jgi:hypothetical protein
MRTEVVQWTTGEWSDMGTRTRNVELCGRAARSWSVGTECCGAGVDGGATHWLTGSVQSTERLVRVLSGGELDVHWRQQERSEEPCQVPRARLRMLRNPSKPGMNAR